MKALLGKDSTLDPKIFRFLEAKTTTSKKSRLDVADKKYYDPWGSTYFIKLNTDYNDVAEYYGNNYVDVLVSSKGPNKTQDDILNIK